MRPRPGLAATFAAIDDSLKKVSAAALKKRDDLLEALGEDDGSSIGSSGFQ